MNKTETPEFGDVIVLRNGTAQFCLGNDGSDQMPVHFVTLSRLSEMELRERPFASQAMVSGGGQCSVDSWRRMARTGKA